MPTNPPNKFKCQLDKLDIHIKHNTDSSASPDPELHVVYIRGNTESPMSPDSALTMVSVSENNPPINPTSGTPMFVKMLVPTPKHLAQLQKILKLQSHLNQLDRSLTSQVPALEDNKHRVHQPLPQLNKLYILKKEL